MNNQLQIIIPCYNPHPNWGVGIVQNMKELQSCYPLLQIDCIIVNDGSAKGFTNNECNYITNALPSTTILSYQNNKGKGYALRYGVENSSANFILYTDLDFPFELKSMQLMIDELLNGADIVLGYRLKTYSQQLYPYRKMLSKLSQNFNKIFLQLQYSDTQGGLKAFNKTGKQIFLQTKINRYLFDTEFILFASKNNNLIIAEVQIATKQGIHLSEMGFSILRKEFFGIFRLLSIKYFYKIK